MINRISIISAVVFFIVNLHEESSVGTTDFIVGPVRSRWTNDDADDRLGTT
jgi:hypothetical protein